MRPRRLLALLLGLGILDAALLGLGWVLHQTVVPAWKKGPLIDPAAPYSPENAIWLGAVAACIAVDVYVASLVLWRTWRPARWFVPLAALLLGWGGAELALRAWLSRTQITYFRPHPTLHWVVRSNLHDFPNVSGGGTITTNADGMRMVDEPREKSTDEYRILVLGDSSNFGHGVKNDETWSYQLEKLLDGKLPGKKIEVLNGACPGWTTYQATEFLRTTGLAYHPDFVIAGFNNDPGPEYFGDRARVMSGPVRWLNTLLFQSESYLVWRETVLSTARRLAPTPDAHYTARTAGESPNYGKLKSDETGGLVPRVSKEEFLANVSELHRLSTEAGASFAWINMPINRLLPDLVERYVNYDYRTSVAEEARQEGFPLFDVDARWLRTREPDLQCPGHVHHPCATGHLRMAQQIGHELLSEGLIPGSSGDVEVGGPPEAPDADTLRLGWSSLTPVHAHIGVVLRDHPELAAKHGLKLELSSFASGGKQGEEVARGALDAFFTCEVPAIQMLASRSDARVLVTPGSLGRVALVARDGVEDLRGRKVGVAPGSTAEMDLREWNVGATTVPLKTDELEAALGAGTVDGIATWDPWVEDIVRRGGVHVVKERAFQSELAVGLIWSVEKEHNATALGELVADALSIAAADRPTWDAKVAEVSGWPVAVVKAVADRNDILAGRVPATLEALRIRQGIQADLERALRFAPQKDLIWAGIDGDALLNGQIPMPRSGVEVAGSQDGTGGPAKGGGAKAPPVGAGKPPPPGGSVKPPPGVEGPKPGVPVGPPPKPGGAVKPPP